MGPSLKSLLLCLAAALGASSPALAGGLTWLPQAYSFHPRSRADWQEPRLGVTWHGDRLEAALGGPMALAAGKHWGLTLEGLATLGLSRDGSFFPLETADGIMELGLEGSRGDWRSKVRIVHWSAHKADGDTSVAYRDQTFSREWISLEAGRMMSGVYAYGRIGGAWHAVPESSGLKTAVGAVWEPQGAGGPYVATHLVLEAADRYRLTQTHVLGWALGTSNRVYLGLRYHHGASPRGQYAHRREDFGGVEIQFRPGARRASRP